MNEETQRVEIRDVSKEVVKQIKIMAVLQDRSIHSIMAEALTEYIERKLAVNSKQADLDAVNQATTLDRFHERRPNELTRFTGNRQ